MYPASKIKLMIFRFFPNNGLLPRKPLHVNRPIPSSKNPYFQNEAKCTSFLLKMRILRSMAEQLTSSGGTRKWPINIPFLIFFSTVAERKLNPHLLVEDHTIQYKFYCQLPMRAFQRQVLIVQVIKKINK